jgi:hypothetical protein
MSAHQISKSPFAAAFDFEDVRPYYDSEAHAALQRMSKDPSFEKLVHHLWPTMSMAEAQEKADRINSVTEFQMEFMHSAIRTLLERSSTSLTGSGFDKLDKNKVYLYVANHRDILLDSAILQVMLVENGLPTSEITIGDNLMEPGFITDFGRMNRMFTVQREGTSRELYDKSRKFSAYIRHTLVDKHVSVWIAQRNGRTKDGLDQTQTGLLKMLNLSGNGNFLESFSQLNIVPVSISYEYEPCDALKTQELYLSSLHSIYKKAPGEDLNSILTGIMGNKGRIHIQADRPLGEELVEMNKCLNENEKIKQLCLHIDTCIQRNYKLWPGNYIAADLLEEGKRFEVHYTLEEKKLFIEYTQAKIQGLKGDPETLIQGFLKMYAAPCLNADKNL